METKKSQQRDSELESASISVLRAGVGCLSSVLMHSLFLPECT